MKKIIAYLLELRAGILPTTILPVLLGAAMARHDGKITAVYTLLQVVLGFCFVHLATNVINDYFDDEDGTDRINTGYIGPFSGGSRLLQKGMLSRKEVFYEAVMLFLISDCFMIYATLSAGLFVFLMYLITVFSGIFYSAPPLRMSRTGFGELLVAVNLGPVVTLTSYYAMAGAMNWSVFFISLPAGLLTAAFVIIAEFPDYIADKKTGKKNLVVRFGAGKAGLIYGFTSLAAYAIIATGLIAGMIPAFGAWALIGAFVSGFAFVELMTKYKEPSKLGIACGLTYAAHFVTIALMIAAYLV